MKGNHCPNVADAGQEMTTHVFLRFYKRLVINSFQV